MITNLISAKSLHVPEIPWTCGKPTKVGWITTPDWEDEGLAYGTIQGYIGIWKKGTKSTPLFSETDSWALITGSSTKTDLSPEVTLVTYNHASGKLVATIL